MPLVEALLFLVVAELVVRADFCFVGCCDCAKLIVGTKDNANATVIARNGNTSVLRGEQFRILTALLTV